MAEHGARPKVISQQVSKKRQHQSKNSAFTEQDDNFRDIVDERGFYHPVLHREVSSHAVWQPRETGSKNINQAINTHQRLYHRSQPANSAKRGLSDSVNELVAKGVSNIELVDSTLGQRDFQSGVYSYNDRPYNRKYEITVEVDGAPTRRNRSVLIGDMPYRKGDSRFHRKCDGAEFDDQLLRKYDSAETKERSSRKYKFPAHHNDSQRKQRTELDSRPKGKYDYSEDYAKHNYGENSIECINLAELENQPERIQKFAEYDSTYYHKCDNAQMSQTSTPQDFEDKRKQFHVLPSHAEERLGFTNPHQLLKHYRSSVEDVMESSFSYPSESVNYDKRNRAVCLRHPHLCQESYSAAHIDVNRYSNVRRKCWARACWSTAKHSHVKDRDELLKASEGFGREYDHMPINAFCHELKRKAQVFFSEIQQNFTLWNSSFKVIEGSFGTGVVSYFVFLRWLLLLNFITFIIMFVFVVLPQVIGTRAILINITNVPATDIFSSDFFDRFPDTVPTLSSSRLETKNFDESLNLLDNSKSISDLGTLLDTYAGEGFLDASLRFSSANFSSKTRIDIANYCSSRYQSWLKSHPRDITTNIQSFFEGSGWMENTTLLIGFYDFAVDIFSDAKYYDIAVALLVVGMVLVVINLFMMMSYASEGVREAMLVKLQETYSCTVFCGWNFCIEDAKAAEHQHNGIFQEIISMLAEGRGRARRKGWTTSYRARIYAIRVSAYMITILMLIGTYALIFYVTEVQLMAEIRYSSGTWGIVSKFLPSLTITGLNLIFPLILDIIIRFEEYKIERQINHLLMRIILMREASIIILVSSFYNQITCEPKDMCGMGYKPCPTLLCWETYVGQQMYRLVMMDFFVHIAVTFCWETPRMFILKRWKSKYNRLLGQPLFDIPMQVLSLVYMQTLTWLGMLYCPLLPAVAVLKIVIFFYLKRFTVLHNYIPSEVPYKASRSNAIFVIVLMLSFFMSLGILSYSVSMMDPSHGCSPFRYHTSMMHAVGAAIYETSHDLYTVVHFMMSPLVIVPMIMLLCLILYYYITKTLAHKKMVELLQVQLSMEGKDKQFLLSRLTKFKEDEERSETPSPSRTRPKGRTPPSSRPR